MDKEISVFESQCSAIRIEIKRLGAGMIALKEIIAGMDLTERSDRGEMTANVMLAYRHLEDAAMRIGKAIQAYEAGVSIYDNNDARRAAGENVSKEATEIRISGAALAFDPKIVPDAKSGKTIESNGERA